MVVRQSEKEKEKEKCLLMLVKLWETTHLRCRGRAYRTQRAFWHVTAGDVLWALYAVVERPML